MKKVDANISRSGETVLGHWDDEYVAMAQGRGASYFDLGSETWEALSDAERLAANQYFLEVIAENGDTVLLSTSKANIRIPSALADEVNYLIKELGYTWYDQLTLLPGN